MRRPAPARGGAAGGAGGARHPGPLVWGDEEARLAEALRALLAERDAACGGEDALRHVPVVAKAPQGRHHHHRGGPHSREQGNEEEKEVQESSSSSESENEGGKEEEAEGEEKEKEEKAEPETVDEVERVRAAVATARATGDVVRVNALIAGYAKDKQLHAAVHALAALLAAVDATVVRTGAGTRPAGRPLRPTVYTLANFVNACANSDDAALASCAYTALTRAYGVAPNVVALTALVKVLANTGRVEAAHAALAAAPSALEANLRTYNALLRGCEHYARGDIAVCTLAHMAAAARAGAADARPDASSYECAVKALCCAGDIARAGTVIAQMEAASAATSPEDAGTAAAADTEPDLRRGVVTNSVSAAAYAAYATTCALMGRAAEALRALARARAVVELRSDPELQIQLERQARGEARGLRRTLLIARNRQASPGAAPATAAAAAAAATRTASVAKFSQHQMRELITELDLIEAYIARTNSSSGGASGVLGGRTFMESARVLVAAPVGPRRVDAAGVAALLGGARAAGQTRLHVELCSGYGDWLVARAAAGRADTLWLGAELLADRAHSVWARAALAGVGARTPSTSCARASRPTASTRTLSTTPSPRRPAPATSSSSRTLSPPRAASSAWAPPSHSSPTTPPSHARPPQPLLPSPLPAPLHSPTASPRTTAPATLTVSGHMAVVSLVIVLRPTRSEWCW